MTKKRYAIVGTGVRSEMYSRALVENYRDTADLVSLCDPNTTRMKFWNDTYTANTGSPLALHRPYEFEKMIQQEKIDEIIVCSMDRTHHDYIIRAMNQGCDVITEKPMTIDTEKCTAILKTIQETGRRLRVTFNYRYAPRNSRVKEIIQEGKVGDILSVHFEWLLNTSHGADYFRRWHRQKSNSGGLMVHKSTHHFDLVNWWLQAHPLQVAAMGGLRFYGRENAERRGQSVYRRGTQDSQGSQDPFALDLTKDPKLKSLYWEAEHEDGYLRDQCVFGDGINIEDDVGVIVQYNSKAVLSYHLNAFSPWEGFRVMFNGTKGRLEYEVVECPYISGSQKDHNAAHNVQGSAAQSIAEPASLTFQPHWGHREEIALPQENEGGHGGGDAKLLDDLFIGSGSDPLGRAASHIDGTYSIMTGIAANQSMATGNIVHIKDLLPGSL